MKFTCTKTVYAMQYDGTNVNTLITFAESHGVKIHRHYMLQDGSQLFLYHSHGDAHLHKNDWLVVAEETKWTFNRVGVCRPEEFKDKYEKCTD